MKRKKVIGRILLSVLVLLFTLAIWMLVVNNKESQLIAETEKEEKAALISSDNKWEYERFSSGIRIKDYRGYETTITIPSTLDGFTVTSIDKDLLTSCGTVESITIPSTVVSWYTSAVSYNPSKLKYINVDSSNPTFSSENGVLFNKDKTILYIYPQQKTSTSYTIPSTVTQVDSWSFYECVLLQNLVIPASVISMSNSSFETCSALKSISVNSNNTIYSSRDGVLFNNDYTELICYPRAKTDTSYIIPDTVKTIGRSSFIYCSLLTNITIPSSVTRIASEAFRGCVSLTSITIPSSVTIIGQKSFYECISLTSMTIPNSVKNLEEETFYNCSSLTSVKIGNSVENIKERVFYGCSSLTNISIPECVINIGYYSFARCDSLTNITVNTNNTKYSSSNGVLFNKDKTELVRYPQGKTATSFTIPSSVTIIQNAAFSRCSNLNKLTIPNSVTGIGRSAFYGCSSLTNITIPNSVTSIDEIAFCDCIELKSVEILNSDINLENNIFLRSSSLTIYCYEKSTAHTYAIDNNINYIFILASKISVSKNPVKMTYVKGYEYDSYCLGGELKVEYNSGRTEIVSMLAEGVTTSEYDSTITGTQSITVTYQGCDTTFNIEVIEEPEFNYTENSDGTLKITKYIGTDTNVYIPKLINGKIVSVIGKNCFLNKTSITDVTMSNTIKTIESNAFDSCSALKEIKMSETLENIEKEAFYFSRLTRVLIPETVINIGNDAFAECDSLESVTVFSKNLNIGTNAIPSNSGLIINCYKKTKVLEYAIENNINYYLIDGLKSIEITMLPIKTTYVKGYEYEELNLIGGKVKITLNNEETTTKDLSDESLIITGYDSSIEGTNTLTVSYIEAIYENENKEINITNTIQTTFDLTITNSSTEFTYLDNEDGTIKITGYTGNDVYVWMPKSIDGKVVSIIGENSFSKNTNITNIKISNSVTIIEEKAFQLCSALLEVEIPSSVINIEDKAFNRCFALSKIVILSQATNIGEDAISSNDGYTKIYCYKNSTSHRYAQTNGIQYVLLEGEVAILEQITIKILPIKQVYQLGENIDLTGGQIILAYSDESTQDISLLTEGQVTEGIEVTGYDKTTVGEQEITVSYTQDDITKTAIFNVDVTKDKIEYIDNENGITITKIECTDGSKKVEIPEKLLGKNVIGIVNNVVTNLNDIEIVNIPNTVKTISDNAFKNTDETTNEELTIECKYGSTAENYAKEKEIYYEFTDKNISGISMNTEPTKTKYELDEEIDLTGGKILITYEGSTEENSITSVISIKKTGVDVTKDSRKGDITTFKVEYKGAYTTFTAQFGLMGDVNNDGEVDISDIIVLKKHVVATMLGETDTDWIIPENIRHLGNLDDANEELDITDVYQLKIKVLESL